MEKRTPHYDLKEIKSLVRTSGPLAFTRTAIDNGKRMGLTMADMIEVLSSLGRQDFYKSMTAYHDHTIWHDVYHAETSAGMVYIKISAPSSGRPVIQFKSK